MNIHINEKTIFEKASTLIDNIENRHGEISDVVFGRLETVNLNLVRSRVPTVKSWLEKTSGSAYSFARTVNTKVKAWSECVKIEIPSISNADFAPIGLDD